MRAPLVRKPWERVRTQISFLEEVIDPQTGQSVVQMQESRTLQHEKENCDVNRIIERYDRTGILPMPKRQGVYADVSKLNEYYGDIVLKAQDDIAKAEAFVAEQKEKLEEAEKLKAEAEAEAAKKSSTTDQQASDSAQASDS